MIEEITLEDFRALLSNVSPGLQKELVEQSLTLLFLKYPQDFEKLNETLSLIDDYRRTEGELKDLDNFEYEKMFKLNLLSRLRSEDLSLRLRLEVKRLRAKLFPNVNRVLDDMQIEARRREAQRYESVMRNPRSLGNHLGAVWNFIKEGQLQKALSYVSLI